MFRIVQRSCAVVALASPRSVAFRSLLLPMTLLSSSSSAELLSSHAAAALTTTSSSSSSSLARSSEELSSDVICPVYIHHVSKKVLQYLQESRSDWLVEQGLDTGLRLNSNGTFVLQFPSTQTGRDAGRIWTSYDASSRKHWLSVYRHKLVGRFMLLQKDEKSSSVHQTQQIHQVVEQLVRALTKENNLDKRRRGWC